MAANGSEALTAMEGPSQADTPFALLVLDAVMPDLGGFALAERIRQQPEPAKTTIMMLTASWTAG